MPSAAARSLISAVSTLLTLSAQVQRSVRRTIPVIVQGFGAGPTSGSARAETARRRPATPGSVRRSSSASRSSHASTASPRALQPHLRHAPFLELGKQQKLAHRAAQDGRGQCARLGRPVHDVSRDIHTGLCRELPDPGPFARRRLHRVLGAARCRSPGHEAAPAGAQSGVTPVQGSP